MPHSIIEDHPEYAAFDRALHQAAEDRDAWVAEAQKRQDAYQAACVEALATGGAIPDAPQSPGAGDQAYHLRAEQVRRQKAAWMKDNAVELEAAMLAREDEIVARAREILAELETLVEEAGHLRSGLVATHQALQDGMGMPHTTGTTIGLLLECARSDTRMLREPYAADYAANRVGLLG